jgi:uncharacterized membrane protein
MSEAERSTLIPIFIILGILLVGSIWIFSWGGYGYMGPGMMGGGYGGGWWMPALMLIFFFIVGVGAYILYRSWTPYRRVESTSGDHSGARAHVGDNIF